MNAIENFWACGLPEYDRELTDHLRGRKGTSANLEKNRPVGGSTYSLSNEADAAYDKALSRESIFRKVASVHKSYGTAAYVFAADSNDIAEFVSEGGAISVTDIKDDFTPIGVDRYKLSAIFRLPCEFVSDANFDIKDYVIKRFARAFAGAEDKAFVTGTGTDEPTGILHNTLGAQTGVSTASLTFDDVVSLYFSVKPEYRKNAVWMMNDTTAMALRKLKDENGAYLWSSTNDTIFGKRVVICEYMPDIASGKKPIVFGDMSYYWIIQRSPVTVRMLYEIYAGTGQYGYLGNEFLDGKLIRREAVKALKVTA